MRVVVVTGDSTQSVPAGRQQDRALLQVINHQNMRGTLIGVCKSLGCYRRELSARGQVSRC